MNLNKTPLAAAMLVVSFAVSPFVLAQDGAKKEDAVAAAPVVITATRAEQPLQDVHRSVDVVDKDELDTLQAQSVPQTLDYQPNVTTSGGPNVHNQTVNIRGLSGNKVLQTVDGVPQIFESGHRPIYFLDPALLESVEVVRGPASSLWGSGAVGGVVSQNTIGARDLVDDGETLGGLVKSGYNFNNDEVASTVALAGRSESVDWLISGYGRDSNEIELGDGTDLVGSELNDKGALAKVEWFLTDDQMLTFNYRQAQTNGHVPSNASSNSLGSSNFLINRDQTVSNMSIDYRFDPSSELVNAQVMVYKNSVDMEESRVSDGRYDSTESDTLGLVLNNQSMLGGVSLLYGIDGYQQDYSGERSGTDRPTPPDAETNVWGAFAQAGIPLNEAFTLELGARYDYFSAEAKNLSESRSDNALSPSVALIWQVDEQLDVTLRHDRAFRGPSAEEMYSTGTHFCMMPGFCNTFLPNPDLEAEESANTELIFNYDETSAAGNRRTFQLAVFRNDVDNFIEQTVSNPTFFPVMDPGNTTWVNVDKAELTGIELSAGFEFGNAGINFGYGHVRGKDKNSGDDLSGIPADTFTADINYLFADQLLTGVRLTHAADQDHTNGTSYSAFDDYSLTDLYVSWEPTALDNLTLNMTVNNLFDMNYRKAWENIDEAGREVILSATYNF